MAKEALKLCEMICLKNKGATNGSLISDLHRITKYPYSVDHKEAYHFSLL